MMFGAPYPSTALVLASSSPAKTTAPASSSSTSKTTGGIGWDAAFAAWLAGRPATTVRARMQDLAALAEFLNVDGERSAALALVLAGEGNARALLHAWTDAMQSSVPRLADATIARRLATVVSLFRELRFHGHTWTPHVRRPKVPRYASKTCIEWTDVLDVGKRLEADGDPQKRAALWLLADVGLRRAELVSLRPAAWLDAAQAVRVRRKGGHVEDRTVSKRCARALVELVAMRQADDALFVGQRGPLTVDGLAEWTHAWGLGGPHALRSAGATELHRRGASATMIQAWLGHASLSTTQVYVRRLDDDAGKATAYLEAAAA